MLLPNVWGRGGALFAFSGMDGSTDVNNQLVGATSSNGRGLVFYTSTRASLHLSFAPDITPVYDDLIVSSDVIATDALISGSRIRFVLIALNNNTILGEIEGIRLESPIEAGINCVIEGATAVVEGSKIEYKAGDEYFTLELEGNTTEPCNTGCSKLIFKHNKLSFIFTYGKSEDYSCCNISSLVDTTVRERLRFYDKLPHPGCNDERTLCTYSKCVSVQKVNCCTAQGDIHFNWTTPDRWPHKHMWIWDSAFHALGLRHYAPDWAVDSIKAVLDKVHPDGFLPHMMTIDDSQDTDIIQPPIIAWSAWKVYQTTGDKSFIEYCYPRIRSMLLYDINDMDTDKDGLAEWGNSCASGMDNSPRFDQPVGGAVDLNSFIVNDLNYLKEMAVLLAKDDDIEYFTRLISERTDTVNRFLWDYDSGFYYDLTPDGEQIRIKTVSGFTPLFAGICSEDQASILIDHLVTKDEFWRSFPVSSVSADEESFCDDMWRGPVWINYNYMIIEGLYRYGYDGLADNLKNITISEIAKWYKIDGIIYEYYDSEGYRSPSILHRKGHSPSDGDTWPLGRCVRDYHWTAALLIDLLFTR
ncbi:MAG: amylo-alpha-1,6-glucosidase [Armatimonadota bacterium]